METCKLCAEDLPIHEHHLEYDIGENEKIFNYFKKIQTNFRILISPQDPEFRPRPKTASTENPKPKFSRSISVRSEDQILYRKTSKISEHKSHLSSCRISLEFGPTELDRVSFIHNSVSHLNKSIGANVSGLESSEHSFQVLYRSDEDIKKFCKEFFNCDPSISSEVRGDFVSKDSGLISITIINPKIFEEDEVFKSDVWRIIRQVKQSFYVICNAEEKSMKLAKRSLTISGVQDDHILTMIDDKGKLYDECYALLRGQIEELESNSASNESVLYALKDLKGKLKRRETSDINKFEEDLKTVLQRNKTHEIVGHLLQDNILTIYVLKDPTEETNTSIREIEATFEDKQLSVKEIDSSFIKPHCNTKPGDRLYNTPDLERYGTLGMYGYLIADDKTAEQDIAITGGHVISKGRTAYISHDNESPIELGPCIWPVDSASAFVVNLPDVAVILVKDSFKKFKCTKLDEDIELYQKQIRFLGGRKVFKYGCTTKETKGKIQIIDSLSVQDAVDPFIVTPTDKDKPFSQKGDSGAVVFTRLEGKLTALGVIVGDCSLLDKRLSENGCLVVSLQDALGRFKAYKKNTKFDFRKF